MTSARTTRTTRTAAGEPPASADILARLQERLAAGERLEGLEAATLVGLDPDTLARLQAAERPLAQVVNALGVRTLSVAQLVFAYDYQIGTPAKNQEVAALIAAAAHQARLGEEPLLAFTAADASSAARVIRKLIGPHLVLALPRQGTPETLSGVRVRSEPAEIAEPGWTPLQAQGRLLGWLMEDGLTVRARFHPCLGGEGRLTVSSATERQRLLYELLSLARRARAKAPSAGQLAGWRQALEQAGQLMQTLSAIDGPLAEEAEAQAEGLTEAEQEVARLSAELAVALEERGTRLVTAHAALARRQAGVIAQADALAQELARLKAMPQLAEVEFDAGWLRIETRPLTVHAGEETLALPGVVFRLALVFGSEPAQLLRFDNPDSHPLLGPDARCLGESFIPFCQQLAQGRLSAAAQIVCGFLQAPIRETYKGRFKRAQPSTPLGFARP